jgi:hypothetical protein
MRAPSGRCMHRPATGRMRPVGLLRMRRSQLILDRDDTAEVL